MDFHIIKEKINAGNNLYINNRKIRIIEIFELFDLCRIIYEDTKEQDMVDKIEISDKKINNQFITINYLIWGDFFGSFVFWTRDGSR